MLQKYFATLLASNEFNYVYYSDEGELLGYVIAGFKAREAVNKFTNDNLMSLLITLIRNPEFAYEKIIEICDRVFGSKNYLKAKCRLYLIAVNDKYKGKGIGKKLILHLEDELRRYGLNIYGLSVRKNNDEAIMFYNSNGYKVEFENTKSIYYIKSIK
jgi:ribosomal protein S18 acetylase RimI-like enzyme